MVREWSEMAWDGLRMVRRLVGPKLANTWPIEGRQKLWGIPKNAEECPSIHQTFMVKWSEDALITVRRWFQIGWPIRGIFLPTTEFVRAVGKSYFIIGLFQFGVYFVVIWLVFFLSYHYFYRTCSSQCMGRITGRLGGSGVGQSWLRNIYTLPFLLTSRLYLLFICFYLLWCNPGFAILQP